MATNNTVKNDSLTALELSLMFKLYVLVNLGNMQNETEERLCVQTGVAKSPSNMANRLF